MAGIKDLYPAETDYKWIKAKEKMNIARSYGATSKRHLAIQVFHAFMKQVLEDMIEENIAFEMPAHRASMLIEQMPVDVFESLREQGKLQYYSTLFNRGKIYVPVYRFKKGKYCYKHRIILGKEMFERLTDLVNQGKRYFGFTRQW